MLFSVAKGIAHRHQHAGARRDARCKHDQKIHPKILHFDMTFAHSFVKKYSKPAAVLKLNAPNIMKTK